jgi:hypothetical protein
LNALQHGGNRNLCKLLDQANLLVSTRTEFFFGKENFKRHPFATNRGTRWVSPQPVHLREENSRIT